MNAKVAGSILRELEHTRTALLPEWLSEDLVQLMSKMGSTLVEMGGLPLPTFPPL